MKLQRITTLISLILIISFTSCKSKEKLEKLDVQAQHTTVTQADIDLFFEKIKHSNITSNTGYLMPVDKDKTMVVKLTDSTLESSNAMFVNNQTNTKTREHTQGKLKDSTKLENTKDIIVEHTQQATTGGNKFSWWKISIPILLLIALMIVIRKTLLR